MSKPTGCEVIQAMADVLTYGGNDRRVLDEKVLAILNEVAKKAAQDAGKAAQRGEI